MAESNVVQFEKKKFSSQDKLIPFLEAYLYKQEKAVKVEKIIKLTGYSRRSLALKKEMIDLYIKILVIIWIITGLYLIIKSDPGETRHWSDRDEN